MPRAAQAVEAPRITGAVNPDRPRRTAPRLTPLEPRSLTHPPPTIWPHSDQLTVWCDQWQLHGANHTLTVGDDLDLTIVPIHGAGLAALFTGPVAADPVHWALELSPATLPTTPAPTRLTGHVRALQALTCVYQRTAAHQVTPVPGSGIKTPIGSTRTHLPGWTERAEPGSPGLLGFFITCTHTHLTP